MTIQHFGVFDREFTPPSLTDISESSTMNDYESSAESEDSDDILQNISHKYTSNNLSNSYTCPTCFVQYQHRHDLAAHSIQEHGILPDDDDDVLKCEYCKKTFLYRSELAHHKKTCHFTAQKLLSVGHFSDCLINIGEMTGSKVINKVFQNKFPQQNKTISSTSSKIIQSTGFSTPVSVNEQNMDESYCDVCDKNFCSIKYFHQHFNNHDHIHKLAIRNKETCPVCNLDLSSLVLISNKVYKCEACDMILDQTKVTEKMRYHIKSASHRDNEAYYKRTGCVKPKKMIEIKIKKKHADYFDYSSDESDYYSKGNVSMKHSPRLANDPRSPTIEELQFINELPYFTDLPKSPEVLKVCEPCGFSAKTLEYHEKTHKHIHMVHYDLNVNCPICDQIEIPRNLCKCRNINCTTCKILKEKFENDENEVFTCFICDSTGKEFYNTHAWKAHTQSHKHLHMEAIKEKTDCKKCGKGYQDKIPENLCKCRGSSCLVCELVIKSIETTDKEMGDLVCRLCFVNPEKAKFKYRSELGLHNSKHKHIHFEAYEKSRTEESVCKKCGEKVIFGDKSTFPHNLCKCLSDNCRICETIKLLHGDGIMKVEKKEVPECTVCQDHSLTFPHVSKYDQHCKTHRHIHMSAFQKGEVCEKCGEKDIPKKLCGCADFDRCKICRAWRKQENERPADTSEKPINKDFIEIEIPTQATKNKSKPTSSPSAPKPVKTTPQCPTCFDDGFSFKNNYARDISIKNIFLF